MKDKSRPKSLYYSGRLHRFIRLRWKDEDTMDVEDARAMVLKAVREEYARP